MTVVLEALVEDVLEAVVEAVVAVVEVKVVAWPWRRPLWRP